MTPGPVATKFARPRVPPSLVHRPALIARLDEPIAVMLVTGSPGAGKTVLVSSWLAAVPERRVVWFSCDERDADETQFWTSIVRACRGLDADLGLDALDLLTEAADLGDVVATLVNDLAAWTEPTVLVIDDLHLVPARALAALESLVEQLPAALRLVICSRSDPVLPLHRWRVSGRLGELRDADLRFRPDEVNAVLRSFGIELSPEEVDVVREHTEGWAAGVQLTALSLRGRDDPASFVREFTGSGRAVADFLIGEVLDRQPPRMVEFLMATAIVDEFDVALCTELTGLPDAGLLLREAEASGLFVVALDATQTWYRYHHLFRDLLRAQLRAGRPDHARALHLRAADWYAASGDLTRAIEHYAAGGDIERAFDIVHDNVTSVFFGGIGNELESWLANLAEESTTGYPDRMVDYAIALGLFGRIEEQGFWLRRCEQFRVRANDPALETRFAGADAFWHILRGEPDAALSFAAKFSALVPGADAVIDNFPLVLSRARLYVEDFGAAIATCDAELSTRSDALSVSVLHGIGARAEYEAGNLRVARARADTALDAAERGGMRSHLALFEAVLTRGSLALEHNRLDEAERFIEDALARSERVRPAFELLALRDLATLWHARGQHNEAFAALDRARAALPAGARSPLPARIDATEAYLRVIVGDMARAAELAARVPESPRRVLLDAHLLVSSGNPERALARLDALVGLELPVRLRLHRELSHARVGIELALEVDAHVAAAVELARAEGFVRTIAFTAPDLQKRISAYLVRLPRDPHSSEVLAAIDQATIAGRSSPSAPVDLLTERELTVIRYLPTRMTTREIAGELFVSMNTLKSHLKSIYRKLDSNSRSEAITKARALGLL